MTQAVGRLALFASSVLLGPAHPPAFALITIPYLPRPPVIDGAADAGSTALPVSTLAPVLPPSPDGPRPPRVRLAYGASFLYALVELDADRLVSRDRAYQNGDGVLLVVARTQPGGAPSDEFSVLGFSAGEPAAQWQRQFVWYRNRSLEMRRLTSGRTATTAGPNGAIFEILVHWSELYPLHPWLAGGLGVNVCVTQAVPAGGPARSCLLDDPRVDAEDSPRFAVPAAFAPRAGATTPQSAAVLDRNHVTAGETVRLRVAVAAAEPAALGVAVRVISGEGTRLVSRRHDLQAAPGIHVHQVEIPVASLPPGGYSVEWEAGGDDGRMGLSVVRRATVEGLLARARALEHRLSPGSVNTLQFRIQEAERERAALRPTDVATSLRHALDDVVETLEAAERGHDLLADRTGILRRAYRSRVDGTLQPYSVAVPQDLGSRERRPLLVYLHGSGEDDRGQVSRPWFPRDFLVLAPRGRGPSTWYWGDHAQDDIREAIDDVIANYPVDTSRVVLAGFSMGGYGVYVTAREQPGRFRALTVFSGTPRARGPVVGAPDFLGAPDLSALARVPWFVFHGGRDRNCPLEDTHALVERLRAAGADVTFVVEEDKGHEAPGPATLAAFGEWLARVMATRRGATGAGARGRAVVGLAAP